MVHGRGKFAASALLFVLTAAGALRAPCMAQEEVDPLSKGGEIGMVLDREGSALVRSLNADRWSVAKRNSRLFAGDWVKAGARGANAVRFVLKGDADIVLGPGALAEIKGDSHLLLCRGEAGVSVGEGKTLLVSAFGTETRKVEGRCSLRAGDDGLSVLEKEPGWLAGYRGRESTEAMGSLLASVEGRNVPLTVGYHKVTVDIRDQIARTVVEESFVNHVGGVLEGVFYFPLPQDASISGFAMWIGGELVEADVVEKERAREIFETILRERRDPALLEWTGGNIFKARIFPIADEKRIRITYTQVLPKVEGEYRYHYALQSDMLRLHPLERLSIDVRVSSSESIESVVCPSHEVRLQTSANAARAQFDAEEQERVLHDPTRCAKERGQGGLPHGNDGSHYHSRNDRHFRFHGRILPGETASFHRYPPLFPVRQGRLQSHDM
jgi:hypothetical protein